MAEEDKTQKNIEGVKKFTKQIGELKVQLSEQTSIVSKLTAEKKEIQEKFDTHIHDTQVQLASEVVGRKLQLGMIKKSESDEETGRVAKFSVDVIREIISSLPTERKQAKLADKGDIEVKLSDEENIRINLFGHK